MTNQSIEGKGHVFLIDCCVEENTTCYLIPTAEFIEDVCTFFDIKENTLESAVGQMIDTESLKNSSDQFSKLFKKWNATEYHFMPCVMNADTTICLSFTDWDQMHGHDSLCQQY